MLDMLGLLVTCSIIVAFGAYVAGPSGFGFTFVMCAWFFLYTLSGRMHQSKKETYQWEVKVGKRKKEWIREDGSIGKNIRITLAGCWKAKNRLSI